MEEMSQNRGFLLDYASVVANCGYMLPIIFVHL